MPWRRPKIGRLQGIISALLVDFYGAQSVEIVLDPGTLNHLQLVPPTVTSFNGDAILVLTRNALVRLPKPRGVKLMMILQLAFTTKLDGQLLVCVKSPRIEMLLTSNGAVPTLVSVMVCDCAVLINKVLPKPNAVLLRRPRGTDTAVPVPLKSTLFADAALAASLAIVIRADLTPSVVGSNDT